MPQPQPSSTPPPRLPITGWRFSNSYAALPARFFARLDPIPVADPRLIKLNRALAAELGLPLDSIDDHTAARIFSGNLLPEGAEPIAMAYAGHQFGQFVPQLGDGRAILLGELIDRSGARRDIQLKGSGRTPFSRGGDGRAALGPVLREYLVSESMYALGVPTTRSLAAVTSGETVYRNARLPGAIVTRVAASHVRVGSFEYFAARGDRDAIKVLADYVIERHYPELKSAREPYLELLRAVCLRQAALIASWMHIGFIHGVMNTDNTAASGETIDFGPCAFMDAYDPATVFSSIDAGGRYAYANQPRAAQWNLARFAETLLSLIDTDPQRAIDTATAVVEAFQPQFDTRWLDGMCRKLGIGRARDDDLELVRDWLELMQRNGADFTVTFRRLGEVAECRAGAEAELRRGFARPEELDAWLERWRLRLKAEPPPAAERAEAMRQANPAYIPRNHLIEAVINAAVEHNDFAPFEEMLEVVSRPYEEQPGRARYAAPPLPEERVLQTFCGT